MSSYGRNRFSNGRASILIQFSFSKPNLYRSVLRQASVDHVKSFHDIIRGRFIKNARRDRNRTEKLATYSVQRNFTSFASPRKFWASVDPHCGLTDLQKTICVIHVELFLWQRIFGQPFEQVEGEWFTAPASELEIGAISAYR